MRSNKIRNSKFETRNRFEIPSSNQPSRCFYQVVPERVDSRDSALSLAPARSWDHHTRGGLNLEYWNFEFASNFGFRVSNFLALGLSTGLTVHSPASWD